MNLFSTDGFLETIADVHFARRSFRIEMFQLEGRTLRLLAVGRSHAPVVQVDFMDFVQPLPERPSGIIRELSYLPRTVLTTTRVEERQPESPGNHPSPFIDWSQFGDWPAFEALVGQRIGNLFPDSRRKRKKLERDVGPISFVFDDDRPEVFERCIEWKRAQYRATGLPDLFARSQNVRLFSELRRKGLVVVTSLTAGKKLCAAHLGGLADQRHYWWVPAYDPALAKYSPGRLMLEEILKESFSRRHRELDFLIGDEAYKFHYATHNRVIGPLGKPPLHLVLKNEAKAKLKSALTEHPRLLALARDLKRLLARR